MAESAAAEETRVVEAIARLLARQCSLLARAADDEAAASAARMGLSWLGELMRSFDLHGAADWFQALRARGDELGATAAWPQLAAPLCEELAGEVSRAGSLAPLSSQVVDWSARVAAVGAFEEPEAREPAPPAEPAIEPEPAPAPQGDPPPAPEPLGEPAPSQAPEIEPPNDPPETPELFEAIADFAGEEAPAIDALHGRVEITGVHPLPTGAMDAAADVLLRSLDRAARAAGAVLLARTEDGGVAWTVRLHKPEARHYLFVERAGAPVALPWSRVVEYGLAPGTENPRVLLGSGLERVDLPIDWLFGKGPGHPTAVPPGAGSAEAPEGFALGGWVRDEDGRVARVLDLALGAESELEPEPEAVQPEPIPADNEPEPVAPPSRVRALVADDSMMARVFLGRLLAQRGIEVDEAEDGAAARAKLAAYDYELIFLDAEMPGAGALEILRGVDADVAARACVLVKDDEERRRAESFGALPILYKPFAEDEVRSAVAALLPRN
jgi:CheY-like chemotaxis protein